ncbi:site-specific integrase [Alphaproteobacteria bacterium]|nr:site-specific integrase [Alphaproteobacteria bacterium]
MALGKQAKTLADKQMKFVLSYIADTRDPLRNKVMFLLSVDAALRACEIASVEWSMVCDADGELTDEIRLQDKSSKGGSGGVVYMSARLKDALAELKQQSDASGTIIKAKSGKPFSAASMTNWFWLLYRDLGFEGCSSHSGRRTAITKWARTISQYNGSMRDVQALARHSSLQMTQRYVEVSEDAMKRVVEC